MASNTQEKQGFLDRNFGITKAHKRRAIIGWSFTALVFCISNGIVFVWGFMTNNTVLHNEVRALDKRTTFMEVQVGLVDAFEKQLTENKEDIKVNSGTLVALREMMNQFRWDANVEIEDIKRRQDAINRILQETGNPYLNNRGHIIR